MVPKAKSIVIVIPMLVKQEVILTFKTKNSFVIVKQLEIDFSSK